MAQLHKKFSDEQVKAILKNYLDGLMTREHAQELLGISKSRFFALLGNYRKDPVGMSIAYQRKSSERIGVEIDQLIRQELGRERALIENKDLPLTSYNYTALRDRLQQKGCRVSLPTIIKRAKEEGCYRPRRKQKVHDREVITSAIGEIIQHDASLHKL